MSLNDKLAALNVTLPPVSGPFGAYVPVKRVGNLIYGPKGNTAGLRKVTVPVKLMTAEETAGYADIVTLDLTYAHPVDSETYQFLMDNGMTREEYAFFLDQKMSGSSTFTPSAPKPTALYEFKDQSTVFLNVRVQRNF